MYIFLGRELEIGQKTTIKVEQVLHDEQHKFKMFLSKVIVEPTDLLILHVKLPDGFHATNAYGVENPSLDANVAYIRKELLPSSSEIKWEVPNPIQNHNYMISWDCNPHPPTGYTPVSPEEPPRFPPLPEHLGLSSG